MKKLVVLAVLLMAVPAMAAVDITVAKTGTNELTISYDATGEANNVRAYALEIIIDDPCISIDTVDCTGNTDYDIYPGSIVIVGDSVTADGQCLCDGGFPGTPDDPNHKTIEAGSLYADGAPAKTGDLAVVTLAGCDSVGAATTCNVQVVENVIRGGVVMENPDEDVTVNLPDGEVGHDLGTCAIPTCWDATECAGQSLGDATCDGTINAVDLFKLKQSWLKSYGQVGYNCCANFNHDSFGVNAVDLFKLKQNWLTSGHTPATLNQDCPVEP